MCPLLLILIRLVIFDCPKFNIGVKIIFILLFTEFTMSNCLGDKVIHRPTTEISESDEIFLKEFSMNFYQKIIDINDDFNIFEDALIKWIKDINKKSELIFELMQNHEQTKFWFSSIIGFFYQFGISCNADKNKTL